MIKKIKAGILSAVLLSSLLGPAVAGAAITSSLELGVSGSQVTELQQFLATDANIYPSGLITGYFGSLTQAAVQRFQAAQGIVSSGSPSTTGYGRVGPATRARINALMGGGVSVGTWDTVPVLSTPIVQNFGTSATVTWSTNEGTLGELYFDTVALRADEATGPNQKPYVSGSLVTINGGYQINHSANLQNLQPNTTYYYLVRNVDTAGNLSMILPTTFRTQ